MECMQSNSQHVGEVFSFLPKEKLVHLKDTRLSFLFSTLGIFWEMILSDGC